MKAFVSSVLSVMVVMVVSAQAQGRDILPTKLRINQSAHLPTGGPDLLHQGVSGLVPYTPPPVPLSVPLIVSFSTTWKEGQLAGAMSSLHRYEGTISGICVMGICIYTKTYTSLGGAFPFATPVVKVGVGLLVKGSAIPSPATAGVQDYTLSVLFEQ